MSNGSDHDRLDGATSARLARLAARPVDTTGLQRRVEAAMAAEVAPRPTGRPAMPGAWRRWRPIAGAAAAILLAAALAWLAMNGGASPAVAAPAELAQVHDEIAAGLAPNLKVSSVEEANQLLADQSSGAVPLPELPGVMHACCLRPHAGATLSCALIERGGVLITVAIADGAKLRSPRGKTIARDGRRFIAHTANGIHMVMAHEDDRWLCVMGRVAFDQLVEVAAGIRL